MSVLLVDDEPAVARTHARLLESAHFAVKVALSGDEALEALSRASFDVIVSDIRMPGMDGLSLLRAIRAVDLDVPVIFLTGSPRLETVIEALEYGAFRYLVKPVARQELIAVVERAAHLHTLALVRREATLTVNGRPIGDRAGLEARFASGVDKIWIAMQPVVSWQARQTFAYEALLRTDDATMRDPTDFVDSAERLGRTRDLGRIVRRAIADQIEQAPSGSTVFVNVHPSDLADEELASRDGALTPHASRVVLEVTERATLDEVPGLAKQVVRLRDIGFRIALDDLGAGYAGLASFAMLEPEIVKVDMTLVRGIHQSPLKQKLFRSFTSLCGDLGVQVVAEGVETDEERDCLTDLGGNLYQGYLFARPDRGFPAPRF